MVTDDSADSPEDGVRGGLNDAKKDIQDIGGWAAFKSGDWILALVRKSFRNYYERATSDYFQEKYPGRDSAFIAKKLISVAARNASICGAMTGAAVTTDEIATLVTAGGGGMSLPANIAIAAGAVMCESVVLLRIQLQLVAELARLSGTPLDSDDPEDILTILSFALGGAAAEAAGKAGMKVGGNVAKAATRRYASGATLEAFKTVGRKLGIKILQRTLVKYAVPIASIGIGAGWNNLSTRAVAKVAQKHFARP